MSMRVLIMWASIYVGIQGFSQVSIHSRLGLQQLSCTGGVKFPDCVVLLVASHLGGGRLRLDRRGMDLRRGHQLLLLLMVGGDLPPLGRGGLVRPRGDGDAALPADEGEGVGAGDDEEDEFEAGEKQRGDEGPREHRFHVWIAQPPEAAVAALPGALALLGEKGNKPAAYTEGTGPEEQTDDDVGAWVNAGFPFALAAYNELDEAPEKGHGELGSVLAVGLWTCEDDDVLRRRGSCSRLPLRVKGPCR